MAVIEKCSEPTVVQIEKEMKSLITDSDRTMPLEEDERMFEEGLSKRAENLISCSSRATRVKFAPMVSYYLTISLDEYTEYEIEKAFWTPKQCKRLNKSRKRTAERMEAGLEEKRSTPYRGLEKYTTWGYRQSVKATNVYVDTVMDEMERQWMEDNLAPWDWEKIASLTQEMTKQSAQEAIKIALSDEKEAKEAYKSIKVNKDIVEPQKQQKLGKSVSKMSAFFGQTKSGLPHRPGKRSSKVRMKKSRLESLIQIAEGQDNR